MVMGDARRLHFPVATGDTIFLACASVGPDSFALAHSSRRLKRRIGRLAYGVAFLGLLWRWPRRRIRLHVDGRGVDCEAFYVAKGRYFAGPWSLAPACRADDPLMYVIALERARRVDFLRLTVALLRGKGMESVPGAQCFTATDLSAESIDAPAPLQADGDVVAILPIRFSVAETPLSFR
jgi:diacylglycerol kinase family enzyme